MSDVVRMPYRDALNIALKYWKEFIPLCEKVKVAGSLRRGKPEVKDIEIVCLPKKIWLPDPELTTLFESVLKQYPTPEFVTYVDTMKRTKGNAYGKYTQIVLPENIKLDLFIANENNFGLTMLLRTGSDKYNIRIMEELHMRGFECEGGYLYYKNSDIMIPVAEEEDFYKVTGIKYTKPTERIY